MCVNSVAKMVMLFFILFCFVFFILSSIPCGGDLDLFVVPHL